MAAQGYQLVTVSFLYQFRKAKPEQSTIKIDYRQFKKEEDFQDYCALFEDSGWKHIAGTRYSGTQYFKRVDPNASKDIFSDANSKAGRYKRLSIFYLLSSFIFLFYLLMTSNSIHFSAILNPKLLYYTPGLWEKEGISFWSSFLFETPFAFIRGFGWWIIFLTFALYIFYSVNAAWQYRKSKEIQHFS